MQTHLTFRRLIQCLYVLGFSILLEFILTGILALGSFSDKVSNFLSVEELHHDAWLIFWGAAALLYLIEYGLRHFYLKNQKAFPLSPLLAIILRSILLFAVIMWVAKYVLNWHGLHILVSATALTAIVGFALKGTIGDLLAGISLHMSNGVMPAQWISLPRLNVEGEVILTNWRETRLRTTSGHIFVIPNSILGRHHFHNMSWPDTQRRHNLDFMLAQKNDPAEVEAALLKATEQHEQIINTPKPPQVIIKAYREFGIHYQLRFWSNTLHDPSSLENAIYRTAWEEFSQRNIEYLRLPSDMSFSTTTEK